MGFLQRLFSRAEPPPPETRATGRGFTADVMAARHAYLAGHGALGELTATVATCAGLWESAFALAAVTGPDGLLTRRVMALAGRSLALRGEVVLLIDGDRLRPAVSWDVALRGGEPRAYKVELPGESGPRTALAPEVLHIVTGADPAAPWSGIPPLRRASLTASLLDSLEAALAETFALAPLGSQVVPMPEIAEGERDRLVASFRGQRGRVLLRESVTVSAAGGPAPQSDWRPSSLSPNIRDAMAVETLAAARDSVAAVYGVLPALLNPSTTGPVVREAQRHLATWVLQPLAELLAEEASAKLGTAVEIDVHRPLQSFDAGGSARAVSTLIEAMARAKEAGLSAAEIAAAFGAVDWKEIVDRPAP